MGVDQQCRYGQGHGKGAAYDAGEQRPPSERHLTGRTATVLQGEGHNISILSARFAGRPAYPIARSDLSSDCTIALSIVFLNIDKSKTSA